MEYLQKDTVSSSYCVPCVYIGYSTPSTPQIKNLATKPQISVRQETE